MKKYIQNITLVAITAVLLAGCGDTVNQITESAAGADISESVEQSYVEEESTQAAESTVSAASEESTDWFTSTLSEQDVTGQGVLGAKGEPYITDGDLITIPIYFNALEDGETARVTAEYGAFERIILDSGMNFVDKHWLEQDEKLEDGDTLWWYQSDDDVKLSYGTVWGHALIEDADGITGYAVFLLNVPKQGWSGSEIVREVRFGEAVTEAQVLEEIARVIEAYSANNEILECVTENIEGAAGENAEEGEAVMFEMTETIYDIKLFSVEQLADGQYALKGIKYYPDIILTEEEKEQLEQLGQLRGFLDGEEKFSITKKSGLYWFKWGEESEYAVQFVTDEEGWIMGRRSASNPIGWHNYGPLDEEFELIVSANQAIICDGVRTQSWGITSETMTVKELYEIYIECGNGWSQNYELDFITLRIYETGDGLEMRITYRP